MPKPKIALILGAGFSCEAGLPHTKGVVKSFLRSPHDGLPLPVEEEITHQLKEFWKYTFNYVGHGSTPSLEDHFTVLDLAANTGRNIGREYTPRKLRAIRRLSIHRIFKILNRYNHNPAIENLLRVLNNESELTVISTNWDRVVENHLEQLGISYAYGVPVETLEGQPRPLGGMTLLMLHGSANWIYCDCCRRLYAELSGKAALDSFIYIARDDFRILSENNEIDIQREETIRIVSQLVNGLDRQNKYCKHCESRLSARIATFSYRKEISTPQFQTVWQQAFSALRDSDIWLFIGYSLPEADFEFRHLLKSAEKAISEQTKQIQVILKKDTKSATRYRQFFGVTKEQTFQGGLSNWVTDDFSRWINPLIGR